VTAAAAPDLLMTIVAATRRIVDVRSRDRSIDALARDRERQPAGDAFARALRSGEPPRVIAECKRRSPSRGILRADYDPAAHARAYASAGAAAISVLTEPTFFDGSLDHLRAVRSAVAVPLLRKDFIVSEYQLHEAVAAGADAVLLIVGALDDAELRQLHSRAQDLGLACLVEVHDVEEARRALDAGARIIGVNSRNLRTLTVDLGVLDAVGAVLPSEITAVAESGIKSSDDLGRLTHAGYKAFLVGERLITQPDPGEALIELRRNRNAWLPPSGGSEQTSERRS
jgi:indole-3-glycerol phosphate synthase